MGYRINKIIKPLIKMGAKLLTFRTAAIIEIVMSSKNGSKKKNLYNPSIM